MKNYSCLVFLPILISMDLVTSCANARESRTQEITEKAPYYLMKTATVQEKKLLFPSPSDFEEALKVGFFRIERPSEINIGMARALCKTFRENPKYNQFGSRGPVSGYIEGPNAQAVRFVLEQDHWNKKKWGAEIEVHDPNYSPEIQTIGGQLKAIGMSILNAILEKFHIPQEMRFKATAGASEGWGSYFLNFNRYDPNKTNPSFGLGAHTDWGHITVLDAIEEGLEAEIEGKWRPLKLEDGYLIINFGEPLAKLLPAVNACTHRVIKQNTPRSSIVMFVDPRVDSYSTMAPEQGNGGVWDWDPNTKRLINGEPTTDYFARLSKALYGETE